MGLNVSFHHSLVTMLSWLFMLVPLLAKRPIENESEGINRENYGAWGRTTSMIFHFQFLSPL
jgi:hypothetical protein